LFRDAPGEDGRLCVTDADIKQAIEEGMDSALAAQEFDASFEGYQSGSFYGQLLSAMRADGRISIVPWNPKLPVHTAWDTGLSDETVCLFVQMENGWVNVIDVMSDRGRGLESYIRELKQKPYQYGVHIGAHDLRQRHFTTGQSTLETAARFGIRFEIPDPLSVQDGIQAVRRLLPRMRVDVDKGRLFLDAMGGYRRVLNEKTQTWSEAPAHTWESNFADAARYLAVGIDRLENARERLRPIGCSGIDPIDPTGTGLGLTQADLEELNDQWRGQRNDAPKYYDERNDDGHGNRDHAYIGYGEGIAQHRRYSEDD
jgi:hypothetical protein